MHNAQCTIEVCAVGARILIVCSDSIVLAECIADGFGGDRKAPKIAAVRRLARMGICPAQQDTIIVHCELCIEYALCIEIGDIMDENNIIVDKTKRFAVRIVNLYKYLCEEKKEYVLSKQLLRCGTSIGANVHEAIRAISKPDFKNKMSIALKEASETEYWLQLLFETNYLTSEQFSSINNDCSEINRILISIVKNS